MRFISSSKLLAAIALVAVSIFFSPARADTIALDSSRGVGNQPWTGALSMPAGQYSIVAQDFSAADLNGNVNFGGVGPTINTGGLISFVDSSRYSNTPALIYPEIVVGGAYPPSGFDAGTFQFTAAGPEPSTYLLLLAGLGFVGFIARRRSTLTRAA